MSHDPTTVTRRSFVGAAMAGGVAAPQTGTGTDPGQGVDGNGTGQQGTANESGQQNGTANGTAAEGQGEGGGQTQTVEMTDELVFAPDSISIAPGDTIVWENVGSVGHSVTAYEDEVPDGATYFASGGFESESEARNAYTAGDPESGDIAGGESFEHTFETEGEYEYFCIPHEAAGMVGSVTVAAGGGAGADEGADVPLVPDPARSMAVAVSVVLLAVVGFTYFVMKYGGDYGLEGTQGGD